MLSEVQTIFSKASGRAGNYRIPSIVRTKNGVLVACADERFYTGRDNPNRIDKVVRRSLDEGKTWQEQIVVVEEVGQSMKDASAAIDPCMLYDENSNKIFMIYSHTPAGVGILTCKKGVGQNENGDLYLYEGKKRYTLKDGKVYDKKGNLIEDYQIMPNGDVIFQGKSAGNYKLKSGRLKELASSHLYITSSEDDGLTWSEPKNISYQVKEKYMSFIGAGPGVGIAVKEGKFKGRLIFPLYYNVVGKGQILMLSACVMYSDDGGVTWHRGVSPNKTRKHGIFKVGDRVVFPNDMITETQLIECEGGILKLFMRNHSSKRLISTAVSDDGGVTWKNYKHHPQLPHCICQCCVINGEEDGKPVTLFLNAADTKARRNGVIRLSYDYGETFEYGILIKNGEFVYSSMVWLGDGKIGVLYEENTRHEEINYVTLTLEDIKSKEQWK